MRSFLRVNKMATDVDVQFFSHLNGLVLSNNWGDMIRLLDTCLVNGLPLPSVTSANVDTQGDITLNLYADHKSLLFQIVELSGFEPAEINGKYRIKGTPAATKLILKATHVGKSVAKIGTAKLASLGYEVVFRDTGDVKRVYRAKDPSAQHPFIRVDETISDGVNSYTSTYAKFAMIGLLEQMDHIDDYHDTSKLQLPLNTTDFTKNWKITGTGTAVKRGWAHWYWATDSTNGAYIRQNATPRSGNRQFTLIGDVDAFYLLPSMDTMIVKPLWGCGLFETAIETSSSKNWFLMSGLTHLGANYDIQVGIAPGFTALTIGGVSSLFQATPIGIDLDSVLCTAITPNTSSGSTTIYSASEIAALQIPFYDEKQYLRGTLKHVCYMGKPIGSAHSTVSIGEASMYVRDNLRTHQNSMQQTEQGGGVYFYLGELE